jgi:hypothetical protein
MVATTVVLDVENRAAAPTQRMSGTQVDDDTVSISVTYGPLDATFTGSFGDDGVPVRGSEASRVCDEDEAGRPSTRPYPPIEAPDAIRHLEEGHAAGKIVVTI